MTCETYKARDLIFSTNAPWVSVSVFVPGGALDFKDEISLVYAPRGDTFMLKISFGYISENNKVKDLRLSTNTAAPQHIFSCLFIAIIMPT